MNKNVVLIDFPKSDNWGFINGIIEKTGFKWEIIEKVSNNRRKSKIGNCIRYFKYFFFSFNVFCKRKKYDKIIAWQQFYGLLLAFFMRLFHVKKRNYLVVMTFIYKPKNGLKGKVYHKFMHYIISSIYIDKIFVYSTSEIKQYAQDFSVSESKFTFVTLGEDIPLNTSKDMLDFNKPFVFSSGFSNRDFDFLVSVAKLLPNIEFYIFSNKKYEENNIHMSDQVIQDRLDIYLSKCLMVAIPLKENRSAGQLTILHSLSRGVPVIATNVDSLSDYIVDGFNGYLCENNAQEWADKINLVLNDENLLNDMKHNSKDIYQNEFTSYAMGIKVGNIIKEYI